MEVKKDDNKCGKCGKVVYLNEEVRGAGKKWHKACFRCQHEGCNISLTVKTCNAAAGMIYCKNHIPKPKATAVADSVLMQHTKAAPAKAAQAGIQRGGGLLPKRAPASEVKSPTSPVPAAGATKFQAGAKVIPKTLEKPKEEPWDAPETVRRKMTVTTAPPPAAAAAVSPPTSPLAAGGPASPMRAMSPARALSPTKKEEPKKPAVVAEEKKAVADEPVDALMSLKPPEPEIASGSAEGWYEETQTRHSLFFNPPLVMKAGKMSGKGGDDNYDFTMEGTYAEGHTDFKLTYTDKRVVPYTGTVSVMGKRTILKGTYVDGERKGKFWIAIAKDEDRQTDRRNVFGLYEYYAWLRFGGLAAEANKAINGKISHDKVVATVKSLIQLVIVKAATYGKQIPIISDENVKKELGVAEAEWKSMGKPFTDYNAPMLTELTYRTLITFGPTDEDILGDSFAVYSGQDNYAVNAFAAVKTANANKDFEAEGIQVKTAIELKHPEGIAVDKAGNLYAVDSSSDTVHKVAPQGTKSVLLKELKAPENVVVDNQTGVIYVGSRFAPILRTNLNGEVQPLKLNPDKRTAQLSGDFAATSPFMSVDDKGILYGVFNQGIYTASVSGEGKSLKDAIKADICTFTVTKKNFAEQDYGECITCGLTGGMGACVSCLKICHKGHKTTPAHFASGFYCDCGDGGKDPKMCKCCKAPEEKKASGIPAEMTQSALTRPRSVFALKGMTVDHKDNIWACDAEKHVVAVMGPSLRSMSFVGLHGEKGHKDGVCSVATFDTPTSVVVDADNIAYICDSGNQCIRVVCPSGMVGTLPVTDLGTPKWLALDAQNNLFVSYPQQGRVRKLVGVSAWVKKNMKWESEKDRYEILTSLGSGASCQVMLAKEKAHPDKEWALKIISKMDPHLSGWFESEVKALKLLHHPNIIEYKDNFEDLDNFYLVTGLMKGGELYDRVINSKHFTEKLASTHFRKVLEALSYCHKKNLVHRDLKPQNLVFETEAEDSNVRVVDFGLAKFIKDNEVETDPCGTPHYLAPWLLLPEWKEKRTGVLWRQCDMWSMGVIIYQMLCGAPPFDAARQNQLFSRICAGKYFFPKRNSGDSDLSPAAKDLIGKLLTLDPTKQLTAEQALQHPWVTGQAAPDVPIPSSVKDALKGLQKNRLRDAVARALKNELVSDAERQQIAVLFKEFDADGNGRLSADELAALMKHLGQPAGDAQKLLESMDGDGDGEVNLSEMEEAQAKNKLASGDAKSNEDAARKAFQKFDVNNDGGVGLDELEKMCAFMSADEAKNLISDIDSNGDGKITVEEWLDAMKNLDSKDSGPDVSNYHAHKLTRVDVVPMRNGRYECEICHEAPIDTAAYFCDSCKFPVCPDCYWVGVRRTNSEKQAKPEQQGLINSLSIINARSDKTVVNQIVSAMQNNELDAFVQAAAIKAALALSDPFGKPENVKALLDGNVHVLTVAALNNHPSNAVLASAANETLRRLFFKPKGADNRPELPPDLIMFGGPIGPPPNPQQDKLAINGGLEACLRVISTNTNDPDLITATLALMEMFLQPSTTYVFHGCDGLDVVLGAMKTHIFHKGLYEISTAVLDKVLLSMDNITKFVENDGITLTVNAWTYHKISDYNVWSVLEKVVGTGMYNDKFAAHLKSIARALLSPEAKAAKDTWSLASRVQEVLEIDADALLAEDTLSVRISYCDKDAKHLARKLFDSLSALNDRSVWVEWGTNGPRGVLDTDVFLYVVSAAGTNDQALNAELFEAVKLNKRIVPVSIRRIDYTQLPRSLPQGLEWVQLTADDWRASLIKVIHAVDSEAVHVKKHTSLLQQANEWVQKGYDKSVLLSSRDVRTATQWVYACAAGLTPRASALHLAFLMEDIEIAKNLFKGSLAADEAFRKAEGKPAKESKEPYNGGGSVYVSYATPNAAYAKAFQTALLNKSKDKKVLLEVSGVKRVDSDDTLSETAKRAIEQTDVFVLVVSPQSLAAKYNKEEWTFALSVSKRVIPVVAQDVSAVANIPAEILSLTWAPLLEKDVSDNKSIDAVLKVIDGDLSHLRLHTSLLVRASAWELANYGQTLIMKAAEYPEARHWVLRSALGRTPGPSKLHLAFIHNDTRLFAEDGVQYVPSLEPQSLRPMDAEEEKAVREFLELTNFNNVDITKLHAVFKKNADKEGFLSKAQFVAATQELEAYGVPKNLAKSEFCDKMFNNFDKNGDGKLSLQEFASAIGVLGKGTKDQKIKFAFDLYDTDHSGAISKEELAAMIKLTSQGVGNLFGDQNPEMKAELDREADERVKELVDLTWPTLDINKDGKITFDEFKQGMAKELKDVNKWLQSLVAKTSPPEMIQFGGGCPIQ